MKFILENNTFQFNDRNFKQIKGTAMGTKVAPTYATLTLGYLENKLYAAVTEKFGGTFGEEFKTRWKRFLDDCFVPWTKSMKELDQLHKILNELHKDLKFTIEANRKQLAFLDVLVKNNEGEIETDIYYKPTDTKAYLLYTSCHPKHTKISIPFALARRLKCIVSNDETLERRFEELTNFLTKQKYPKELIKGGIQKAKTLNREELRNVQEKEKEDIIPYVSTFNPNNSEIYGEIHSDIKVLRRDEHMKEVLKKYNFIKCKRQSQNLKKLLTKAKFSEQTITKSVQKCNRPKCGLCKFLIEDNKYEFKCGKSFTVNQNMTCDVKNLIYVIRCAGCKEDYIGETSNLRNRVTVHNQQIRDPNTRKIQLSQHLDECSYTGQKYQIFPFFKLQNDSIIQRKQKETYFITKFKPKLNSNT